MRLGLTRVDAEEELLIHGLIYFHSKELIISG